MSERGREEIRLTKFDIHHFWGILSVASTHRSMYFVPADGYVRQDAKDQVDDHSDDDFAEFGLYATRMKIPDHNLPIRKEKKKILKTIADNRVTIIVGATGSGKSTIIPAYLLASSRTEYVKMAVTQPRRVAAIKLCERLGSFMIAAENSSGTSLVGFGIRGWQAYDSSTKINYVTTGYLQRILAYAPHCMTDYSHVLLDEVHERSIDSDFLCLIVKILIQLPQNRHVRLVIMSATMQASLYQNFFTVVNMGKPPNMLYLDSVGQYKVEKVYLEHIMRFLPDGCKWTHEQALAQFIVDANASSGGARSEFTDAIRELLVQLVLRFARDGQTTLVFLPGHGDMVHVTEILEGELMRRGETMVSVVDDIEAYLAFTKTATKTFYEIYPLHGMMPQSQMKQPLQKPPAMARRIILATNVAESSLTVANVNVVIDSGLRKIAKYDYEGGFSRLVNTWCSKASITQRLGRAGRVCDGICVRLFTREWEERVLTDYDAPDAAVDNFSKVLLFSKQICENFHRLGIIPSPKPSFMLSQLPDPPEPGHMDAAILSLHQSGLTKGDLSETAPLTILGMLASRLQVDVAYSRLIYYSWMMGYTIEGIVLAAACSMERDVFRYPTRYSQGNETKFGKDSRNSLKWRELFDSGAMSEPIAYRNLMLSWICARTNVEMDRITHPVPVFHHAAVFSAEFEAFKCLCESIAERFEHFVVEELGLPPIEDIAVFRYILNRYSVRHGESVFDDACSTEKMNGLVIERVPYLMPGTFLDLKFLLVLALNRRIFHAKATSAFKDPSYGMSFKLSNLADECIDKNLLGLKEPAIRQLMLRLCGQECSNISFSPRRDEVRVVPGENMYGNQLLVPEAVRVAHQFFDRRRVQFRLREGEEFEPVSSGFNLYNGTGVDSDDFICLQRPRVTNLATWFHLTTVKDSRMKTRRSLIPVKFNFRSPVAYLVHSTEASQTEDYWAVASSIQGLSTTPDREGLSWLTETRADYATILPSEFGGSLALVMLLVGLPFRTSGLEALISIDDKTGDYRIRKLCFDGKWFNVHPLYPITSAILSRVTAVRDLIISSTSVGREDCGDISHALRQIGFVMKLLRGTVDALFKACDEWFSKTEPEPEVAWSQKIVKLVDVSKGPQLLTDSRLWMTRDEPIDPLMFEEENNEGELTPRKSKRSVFFGQFDSPGSTTFSNSDSITPEQLRVARDRMKYIGYSQREIDSRFPVW